MTELATKTTKLLNVGDFKVVLDKLPERESPPETAATIWNALSVGSGSTLFSEEHDQLSKSSFDAWALLHLMSPSRHTYRLDRPTTLPWTTAEGLWRIVEGWKQVSFDEQRERAKLLGQINASEKFLSSRIAKRLITRLTFLLDVSFEEQSAGELPMLEASLLGFLAFIKSIPNCAYPEITLTANGEIFSEWQEGKNMFSVRFLSRDRVSYVVFLADEDHTRIDDHHSGVQSLVNLVDTVAYHRVSDWLIER